MTAFAEVLADLEVAGLRLRRAWPRSPEHLLLDLDDLATGTQTAAQWFAEQNTADRIARSTPRAAVRGRLVLHNAGADRRLPALGPLLDRPGSRLIAHRPERRAVVALDDGARYAKLVPARKVTALRRSVRRAEQLPIRTPRRVGADNDAMVVTGALPGTPLADPLHGPRALEALRAVGAAVARLHGEPPPSGSTMHGPLDELAVTTGWERWTDLFELTSGTVRGATDLAALRTPAPELRLIHRDLHDGQFLLTTDPHGRLTDIGVGLLDFDLAGAGDPALDLANLIEHLLLRGRQGVLTDVDGAVGALLDGYDPPADLLRRLDPYRALTARRLDALYAFRTTILVT